jgi:hypothetical protein
MKCPRIVSTDLNDLRLLGRVLLLEALSVCLGKGSFMRPHMEQLLEQVHRCLRLNDQHASTFASRVRRRVSRIQAKRDSRLPLIIGVAPHPPRVFSVTLDHAPVPARGKRVRSRLREELADDLGS